MARLYRCGPGSPYGCGHHDEHVRAARLGWLRRRLGLSSTVLASEDEHRWLGRVVGDVRGAHTHHTHPDVIAFKQGRRWYELPRSEFKSLIRAGRDIEREEQQEAKRQERERQAIEEYRRAEASEAKRQARQAETARRQAERYQAFQERQVRSVARAERAEVVKLIKERGGIRTVTSAATGKRRDVGELETLPTEIRRQSGHLTLDTARELVAEEMPWLNLETTNDFLDFFERSRVVRTQQQYHARQRRKAS